MGKGKYEPTVLDRARDELFSHIQRCGVLEAETEQREEWLRDTIDYLAERYPDLSSSELDQLLTMGRRYCSPAIPHGSQHADDVHGDLASGDVEVTPGQELEVAEAEQSGISAA